MILPECDFFRNVISSGLPAMNVFGERKKKAPRLGFSDGGAFFCFLEDIDAGGYRKNRLAYSLGGGEPGLLGLSRLPPVGPEPATTFLGDRTVSMVNAVKAAYFPDLARASLRLICSSFLIKSFSIILFFSPEFYPELIDHHFAGGLTVAV